jgi:hypothetical protein
MGCSRTDVLASSPKRSGFFSWWLLLCLPAAAAWATTTAPVGPGATDVSPHQIVRTSTNYLYVIAPTTTTYPNNPQALLYVWKANQVGAPTSFEAKDSGHAPRIGISTSASAINGSDVIHSLWLDGQGRVSYGRFHTATDRWGATQVLSQTGWSGLLGDEGVAIAVDAKGNPHAFWTVKVNGKLRVDYANRIGGTWSKPVLADEATVINAWHPTMAFAPNGDLLLAYIDGLGNYSADGKIRTRVRHASGTWAASQSVPVVAFTGLDNGPSLLITADGTQHITFCDTSNQIQYWYNKGLGWTGDQQPAVQVTHDPALGPDGSGGLYIYGHGTPQGGIRGVGSNKYRFHKPAGTTAWGPWTLVVAGKIDDSTSTRWSQFFHQFPQTVDFTYWTHTDLGDAMGYRIHTGTDVGAKNQ